MGPVGASRRRSVAASAASGASGGVRASKRRSVWTRQSVAAPQRPPKLRPPLHMQCENTNLSANSILTERRSERSNPSQTLSWNLIQTTVGEPTNDVEATPGERSRARKRQDNVRSTASSQSPRRDNNAMGSNQTTLTAEQRLDIMLAEYRNRTPRGGEQLIGGNLVGSPMGSPISPSQAIQMRSPPRELTRPLPAHPENITITDFTSDDAGRRVTDIAETQ